MMEIPKHWWEEELKNYLYVTERQIKCLKKFIENVIDQERWEHLNPFTNERYPSFWKIVTGSPQWQAWQKEQLRRMHLLAENKEIKEQIYDMSEVEECGWISSRHFQDFIKFIKEIK